MIRTERLMIFMCVHKLHIPTSFGGLRYRNSVHESENCTCCIKDVCMDYRHCIVPTHKNFSSGLTHFCTILRHDGQHPPFVYTDSYNVTVHAQMMETSKQVVRWEKCFF